MGKYTLQQIREENILTKERANHIEDICSCYSSLQEINSFEEFLIVISSLSPQSKSPLVEDFLSRKNNLEKVSPSITHRTKRANSENKNNEYSITIPMKKCHYWNKEYKKDIIWGD